MAAPEGREGHDTLADELDLLTVQEAGARLTDELAELRARVAGTSAGDPGLDATRKRISVLERAVARLKELPSI